MKLLSLDLLAFGPFTDVSLSFDADALSGRDRLHIIYGPNEAGKSSSLRALVQLLYGMPHLSADDFVHNKDQLRIGARLVDADGRELACVRRKGRKHTLRDGDDDQPLDPQQIVRLVDHLDEDSFQQQFALSYEKLVQGGQEIVRGGGDLGRILFATGSGVADLGEVQARLDDEVQRLFKDKGRNPRINEALGRLTQLGKERKGAEVPSAQWKRHDDALRQAHSRREKLDKQRRELEIRRDRLRRLRDAAGLVARRSVVLTELESVKDTPRLGEDFPELRRKAQQDLLLAESARKDSSEKLKQIDQSLSAENESASAAVLSRADAIGQLAQDLGAFLKARSDRPLREAEAGQFERDAREILHTLGAGELPFDQCDRLRVDIATRKRLQQLAGEQPRLVARDEKAEEECARIQRQQRDVEREAEQLAAPADSSLLQQALRRAQSEGDLDRQMASLEEELNDARQQADVDLRKLSGWSGNLAALEMLAVPDASRVDDFADRCEAARRSLEAIATDLGTAKSQRDELAAEIDRLEGTDGVPSREQLDEARARRDALWRLVVADWRDGKADPAEIERAIGDWPPAADLAEAFARAVAAADELADRLLREADRVAKMEGLQFDLKRTGEKIQQLEQRHAEAKAHDDDLQVQWHALWKPLAVAPLPPRQMHPWLRQQQALASAAQQIRRREARLADLTTRREHHRDELRQQLTTVGAAGSEDATLSELIDAADAALAGLKELAHHRETLQRRSSDLSGELPGAIESLQSAREALDQWQSQWSKVLARATLPGGTTPEEASEVVALRDDLFAKLHEAEGLRQRIADIDRDAKIFAEQVRQIADQVAPDDWPKDWSERPSDVNATALEQLLREAESDRTRHLALEKQRQEESRRENEARQAAERAGIALSNLCNEAGCSSPAELVESERRAEQRRLAEQRLRELDEQLALLASGQTLDEFAHDVNDSRSDDLQSQIATLDADLERVDAELPEILKTIGREQTELARMDGSSRAAELYEQQQEVLAQLRGDTEQYVRLQLASAVLRRAIDRYRESNQGPLVQRASELFAELTLGSFAGLKIDYNDRGEPVLVGIRAGSGAAVAVAGMSDGTSDQLYLALRLASLERHLDHRPAIPLVLDDVLIKFDDDRTTAALKVFARLAERTQVIYFTHHEHLVRLAEDSLPDDAYAVCRLDCRGASRPGGVVSS